MFDKITDSIVNAFSGGAGIFVSKALAFLGLSFLSTQYAGPAIVAYLNSQLSGLSSDAIQILAYLGVDDCIGVIGSALATKLVSRVVLGQTPEA